jgi:formylglycine-generating enzyme required for sulfatase activity
VALPNPLPDNPTRWSGWKNYSSPNFYERLCLDFDSNASPEQIEENCRQLLVWWQKKLPLKNQPSNPLAQMLRGGLDEAPVFLAEARSKLLNSESRERIDSELRQQIVEGAVSEFKKILQFVLADKQLSEEGERRLFDAGRASALSDEEIRTAIESEMVRLGAVRVLSVPAAPPATPSAPVAPPTSSAPHEGTKDAFGEFRRLLRMSRLGLDGEEMSDDQRDAMCNLGESLGLEGGQAEDLIDEYLEEMSGLPPPPLGSAPVRPAPKSAGAPTTPVAAPAAPKPPTINTSPLARSQEKVKYPNFTNSAGGEMFLITSGVFHIGSAERYALPNEQPVTPVTISCFYLGRFPITNAQYELFDPSHRVKRAKGAGDLHPVIYVNSREAEKFCKWLGQKERKNYRLPTEAEWEYAARGLDGRIYPWGEHLDAGSYANFADVNTTFPWRDASIDDGFAETSPVGTYPRGASPFGIEDLAGNISEWCLDFFEPYRGKEIVNRRGPLQGTQRVYRGGSWRSKASSLRASARHFNSPDYSSNEIGFRVVCEVE